MDKSNGIEVSNMKYIHRDTTQLLKFESKLKKVFIYNNQ